MAIHEVTITALKNPFAANNDGDFSLDYFEYKISASSEYEATEKAKTKHYEKYPQGNGVYESYVSA